MDKTDGGRTLGFTDSKQQRHQQIVERRKLVWELIRSGVVDRRSIAAALRQQGVQVGKSTVQCDITATLAEFKKERLDNCEAMVSSEAAQLDSYEQSLAMKVKGGDTKAVLAAVKVKERRARLLGLDAPDRWAHEAEMQRLITLQQLLGFMRQLTGEFINLIEDYVVEPEKRAALRLAVARRFALASGGRSYEDVGAAGAPRAAADVIDAVAEDPPADDRPSAG